MKASVKYKVIYRHKDSYSISEMCRFFEVSRSGYYDFVNRLDTPAKDLPLDQMIQQCQEQCRNTYGYRRVHIWLERQGVHKNPKTVLRIMRKYNLLAVIRCRKYKHYRDTLHRYPNLLNRNFHADRPKACRTGKRISGQSIRLFGMNHPEAGLKKSSGSACLTKNYKHIEKTVNSNFNLYERKNCGLFVFRRR